MAFKGDILAMILGALRSEPLHGYEIVRRLREAGGAGRLSEGQIYPYLHKLEAEGLVSAEWHTDTGAAARRVYKLTIAGEQELARHRALWETFVSGVGALLAAEPAPLGGGNV